MAFTEDLDLFLNTDEHAVPVTAGSVSGNSILDMPSVILEAILQYVKP